MQGEGLVATYLEESPSGPPRKYYRLTETGRASFAQQLADWRAFTNAVDGLIDETAAATALARKGETDDDA